ncbi:MATE family efflux transporter [Serratia marcescens]|uniref:MATE family efflux transporter n=1 Tax=Serratia marcescens TaxID=615 RepID=UPI003FA78DCC
MILMTRLSFITSYNKILLKASIPIVMQTLLFSSKGFIDIILLGFVSANSVAAAGLADRIIMIVIIILSCLSSGGGYIASQCYLNKEKFSSVITLTLLITLSFAIFLMVLSFVFHDKILVNPSVDINTSQLTGKYLHIVSLSFPLMALSLIMSVLLRIYNQANKVLLIFSVGLAINIIISLGLILWLGLDISGAAWGTVTGVFVEFSLLSLCVLSIRDKVISIKGITLARLKAILLHSVSSGIGGLIWVLGSFLFYVLVGRTGSNVLYILAILTPIESLLLSFALGVTTASGIELGKRIPVYPRAYIYYFVYQTLGLTLCMTLFLVMIALPILWLAFDLYFITIKQFPHFILMMLFVVLLKSISIQLINGILRCGGDIRFCLLLDGCVQWGVMLPCAYIMVSLKYPGEYVYSIVIFEESIKIIICYWRLKSDLWRRNLVAGY